MTGHLVHLWREAKWEDARTVQMYCDRCGIQRTFKWVPATPSALHPDQAKLFEGAK